MTQIIEPKDWDKLLIVSSHQSSGLPYSSLPPCMWQFSALGHIACSWNSHIHLHSVKLWAPSDFFNFLWVHLWSLGSNKPAWHTEDSLRLSAGHWHSHLIVVVESVLYSSTIRAIQNQNHTMTNQVVKPFMTKGGLSISLKSPSSALNLVIRPTRTLSDLTYYPEILFEQVTKCLFVKPCN